MKKLFYLFILVFTVCFVCEKHPALAVDPCLTIVNSPSPQVRTEPAVHEHEVNGEPQVVARPAVAIINGEPQIQLRAAAAISHARWTREDTVAQETGSTLILTVRFLDGTLNDRERVRQIAPEWSQHADIRFEFVEQGPSDIRIGFDPDDSTLR